MDLTNPPKRYRAMIADDDRIIATFFGRSGENL
jgi:hypothetical protein